MKQNPHIAEIDLRDVPALYDQIKYADDELFFADNITSIPSLGKVFKVNFVTLMFCLQGRLSLKLNGANQELEPNDGLVVASNSVLDVVDRSDDFRCVICGFSSEMGFEFINKSLFDALMSIRVNPVVKFTPDEITLMIKYYELAKFKMEHPELNFGRETMVTILRSFTYDLLSSMSRHLKGDTDEAMLRQGDKIYRRFVLMLADSQQVQRSVSSYADELCISPKYLTSICQQHAGQPASELIAQSLVRHIKKMLLYSDLTIKEVAAQLGFSNLSFFGKYVKKHLGLSPNNFRLQNGYGK